MKKNFLIPLLIFFSIESAHAKLERYDLDKEHTSILFFVNHLGFSNTVGKFTDFDGHFLFDIENPLESSVEVVIQSAGVDMGSKRFSEEMRGESWLNVDKYPTITFKSSEIKFSGHKEAKVRGWVTFLGQTHSEVINVKFNKAGTNIATGRYTAGFSANFTINRSRYGMISEIPFIDENVKLLIEVEGIRKGN